MISTPTLEHSAIRFDTFVSYNSKDVAIVSSIVAHLHSRRLRCWVDYEQINAGDRTNEAIVRGMDSSRTAIVFVGP